MALSWFAYVHTLDREHIHTLFAYAHTSLEIVLRTMDAVDDGLSRWLFGW